MLQPSKRNQDGPTNRATQQKVSDSFHQTLLCNFAFDQTFRSEKLLVGENRPYAPSGGERHDYDDGDEEDVGRVG